MISCEQERVVSLLLAGSITKKQFASMRSHARRLGNLPLSIELAGAFEIYKYRVKYGEKRET